MNDVHCRRGLDATVTTVPAAAYSNLRFKALNTRLPAAERRERQAALLRDIGAATACMARSLGPSHLLVLGAQRYASQLGATVAA
ncbi:hypothetical protein MNEG_2710 [Monoraphidium neglectum]|uniref:Uncharacterized protein n=1 Tax=Monoraphidium neglectum TaxID=145388 RepID=A0A0D2LF00_9CHLO|nr:hypothetical protein MNEG_2710 [Monoraphidium neglectum]KIZ05244.1 hypothetical protein MNEG_2710 [Monoraphidium neglectum]|eukprot:XP_013904263.1 hypothetical protein MNEG_2710 [Monoraphidium neglectum]